MNYFNLTNYLLKISSRRKVNKCDDIKNIFYFCDLFYDGAVMCKVCDRRMTVVDMYI